MTLQGWQDKAVKLLLFGVASTSILVVLLIFLFLGREAFPFLQEPGIKALFDTRWIPVSFQKVRFGLLPLFTGSLLITGLATLITIPFSVFGAIYIAEMARPAEREFLKPFIEILSAIPSVVLGFFGLIVLAPLVKSIFHLYSGLNCHQCK